MILTGHGGACCAIKHIRGLGSSPYVIIGAQAIGGINVPREKAATRLARLISHQKTVQMEGVIEVTIADNQAYNNGPGQFYRWPKKLLDLGFKLTFEAYNSNSGNNVRVYHLKYGVNNEAE